MTFNKIRSLAIGAAMATVLALPLASFGTTPKLEAAETLAKPTHGKTRLPGGTKSKPKKESTRKKVRSKSKKASKHTMKKHQAKRGHKVAKAVMHKMRKAGK